MSNGGKDIEVPSGDGTTVIYQVKWTSKVEQDPVAWLKDAIEGERESIERFVREERATKYILMTSVAGTSVPKRGSMPRLEVELAESSKRFGVPMVCLWQADIDAMVDAAYQQRHPDHVRRIRKVVREFEEVRFLVPPCRAAVGVDELYMAGGSSTTTTLPSGSRSMNMSGAPPLRDSSSFRSGRRIPARAATSGQSQSQF
ncbi:MAG: hypothetical protein LH624_04090 [Cryobacterium sp.]|nr:hypothetical protein [Cryobacterium sp.]